MDVNVLAQIMGTSVAQIEDMYGRCLGRTNARLRANFDAYDFASAERQARAVYAN